MFSVIFKIFRLVSIIGIIIFPILAINQYFKESEFIKNKIETNGAVVDFVANRTGGGIGSGGRNIIVTCPIVEYMALDGQSYRIKSRVCFGDIPKAYGFGERVNVLYNPQNPQEARINNLINLYSTSFGMLIMFIFCLLAFFILKIFKKLEIK